MGRAIRRAVLGPSPVPYANVGLSFSAGLLDREGVGGEIETARVAHVAHEVLDDDAIDIIATEERVARLMAMQDEVHRRQGPIGN